MELITLKGVKIMSVDKAKSKIASFYPNLQTWIQQKVAPSEQSISVSTSFQQDLEPLLQLKSNMNHLEKLNHRMNFMMREFQSIIKK